jgi:hypothetical protein
MVVLSLSDEAAEDNGNATDVFSRLSFITTGDSRDTVLKGHDSSFSEHFQSTYSP